MCTPCLVAEIPPPGCTHLVLERRSHIAGNLPSKVSIGHALQAAAACLWWWATQVRCRWYTLAVVEQAIKGCGVDMGLRPQLLDCVLGAAVVGPLLVLSGSNKVV
jgi:hypothetical protein